MLALERIIGAAVEPFEGRAGEYAVPDFQSCARQADGGGFLEGKSQGVGGNPEGPWAKNGRSVPVAAEIELGAVLVVQVCHLCPMDLRRCAGRCAAPSLRRGARGPAGALVGSPAER